MNLCEIHMHFKQDSVARKTNCFQEANIFVKPCGMPGVEVGKRGPAPLVKHRAPHLVDPAQLTLKSFDYQPQVWTTPASVHYPWQVLTTPCKC